MNSKNYSLNFLSGGASLDARWIVIRILTGVWCLACFFLVQIYCCTLTSHLTLPHSKPIVNSVYDIPNVPGFEITVDRNLGADMLISVLVLFKCSQSSVVNRFLNQYRKQVPVLLNIWATCYELTRNCAATTLTCV